MAKKLLITFGVAALLLLGVGVAAWWWIGRPMYVPGEVRDRADLAPPSRQPPTEGPSGRWKMPDDVELAWFARGQGRPVLVVHGGPGLPPSNPWSGLERLQDDFRLYYYAQRGSGASTRPFDRFDGQNTWEVMQTIEDKLGLAAQIADIERIRRILDQERLLIVGHSFGGLIASLYAAEFPSHVDRLLLIAPADVLVMPPPDGGPFEQIERRLPEADRGRWREFINDVLDFGRLAERSEQELAQQQRTWATFYARAAGLSETAMGDSVAPAGGWVVPACYLGLGMRHDWRAALTAVNRPVLVVHGTDDLMPVDRSQLYADAFPNAVLQTIAGAGHFPQESHPTEFAELVRSFLDRSHR